jgi:hypothetical protein
MSGEVSEVVVVGHREKRWRSVGGKVLIGADITETENNVHVYTKQCTITSFVLSFTTRVRMTIRLSVMGLLAAIIFCRWPC